MTTPQTVASVATYAAPAGVRRAMLPWNRKTPSPSRVNFVPRRWRRELDGAWDPVSAFVTIVLFPLWLPAAVLALVVVAEGLLAALFTPFALIYRAVRHSWAVDVLNGWGKLISRERLPSWRTAGARARDLRSEYADTMRGWACSSFLPLTPELEAKHLAERRDEASGGPPTAKATGEERTA